jgi:threonine dehydrogenase-like Zn-dependent dehydrogenase
MAEHAAVPANQLIAIPDEMSFQTGALLEPIAVAVHALRETGFTSGDNALVFGCGTIGLCVALTLRLFGARYPSGGNRSCKNHACKILGI